MFTNHTVIKQLTQLNSLYKKLFIMNIKSRIISLSLIIVLSIFLSGSVYAQGVFKNQATTTEESSETNTGIFKAGPAPGDGDGVQPPGSTPVGEGLAILSLLSGAYFMLKKRNTKK